MGSEADAVVSHDALNPDTMCPIEAQCVEEKVQARAAFFIGQDFGVSDARAVVDRQMQILPAYPTAVALALAVTGDARNGRAF
jgi:hypothetical protein